MAFYKKGLYTNRFPWPNVLLNNFFGASKTKMIFINCLWGGLFFEIICLSTKFFGPEIFCTSIFFNNIVKKKCEELYQTKCIQISNLYVTLTKTLIQSKWSLTLKTQVLYPFNALKYGSKSSKKKVKIWFSVPLNLSAQIYAI